MINYWTVVIQKKKAIKEINRLLYVLIGEPAIKLDDILNRCRFIVMEYFQKNPECFNIFVRNNSLHCQFLIEENKKGFIANITFVEKN